MQLPTPNTHMHTTEVKGQHAYIKVGISVGASVRNLALNLPVGEFMKKLKKKNTMDLIARFTLKRPKFCWTKIHACPPHVIVSPSQKWQTLIAIR